MRKFRCKVCGYTVEMDEMPDDYVCPICGVSHDLFEEVESDFDKRIPISKDNPSVVRIMEKCINCGRCKDICEQVVGVKYDHEKALEPVCINCGQCILNCPVGSLVPRYNYLKVLDYIKDTSKIVVVSTSPAVRVALGDEFGLEPGSFVEGKMVSALRNVGFDLVFDTTFGADLTVMEEASELLERLKSNQHLPQFTSCCPAWVKYLEIYHPELLDHLSTSKSPIGMQGAIIKTYLAKQREIEPKDIIHVALTPCTAKKYEIKRQELNNSTLYNNDQGNYMDTDYVITTSELSMMIRELGLDFKNLEDSHYDDLLNRGSGAGLIFGATGGVMEAALRCAYYLITKTNPPENFLNLKEVRGLDSIKEADVVIDNYHLKVAVIHGLTNIEPVLKEISEGKRTYDFIEVMNCRGGCIGGGGQPLTIVSKQEEVRSKRISSLYQHDTSSKIRNSYENMDIKLLYDKFLGYPLSDLSLKLLHTNYHSKKDILGK